MERLEADFRQEMGSNPMATRKGLKQVDGFMIELYTDTILTDASVICVYREAFDSENHYRRFKEVGRKWMNEYHQAKSDYDYITNKNDVVSFIKNFPPEKN